MISSTVSVILKGFYRFTTLARQLDVRGCSLLGQP
jgi:hypothetical protein